MSADLGAELAVVFEGVAGGGVVEAEDCGAVFEELELFALLLLKGGEVFLMGLSQAGEDADGGLYDALEGVHLARL